jgi:hypothetical protein
MQMLPPAHRSQGSSAAGELLVHLSLQDNSKLNLFSSLNMPSAVSATGKLVR